MTIKQWYTKVLGRLHSKNGFHQRFTGNGIFKVLVAGVLWLGGAAYATDLTIFAAASLKEALDENVKAFAAKTGHLVRVSYAGSNALARQIENGAPADLFIPAERNGWTMSRRRA